MESSAHEVGLKTTRPYVSMLGSPTGTGHRRGWRCQPRGPKGHDSNMAYFFLVERGPRPGLQLSVALGRPLVMGRGSAVDLPLPAEDRTISRRHVEVLADHEGVMVKPLSNSGLTLVNGVPVARRTKLGVGDSVQLGETLVRLFTDAAPTPDDEEEGEDGVEDVHDAILVSDSS